MLDNWTTWLLIIVIGLITFGLRFSFIALSGRLAMPPQLQQALRFVPAAVLTALIMPQFLYIDGTLDMSFANERLLAAVLAALTAWRTRNILLTIVVGMVALWVLQALLPR